MDELYGTWHKAASLKSNYNLPKHKMLNTGLSRILKSSEIQSPVSTMQGDSSQSPKEEPTEGSENHVEAEHMHEDQWRNTIHRQARTHKLLVEKAAAAPAAKRNQQEAAGKKPVVKKGKKPRTVGIKEKKCVVGKKAAAARKPAEDRKPAKEKKPAGEEKKPAAGSLRFLYSRKGKSLWTTYFE